MKVTLEQKTVKFKFLNLFWIVILANSKYDPSVLKIFRLQGPFCADSECMGELEISGAGLEGTCPICGKTYKFTESIERWRQVAHKKFEADLNKKLPFVSIESLKEPLIIKDEDDRYWLKVKMGFTNDGRKIVTVLVGDKEQPGKTHIFLDLDKEQMRFDWKDKQPSDVIAKLEAEFVNVSHLIRKK